MSKYSEREQELRQELRQEMVREFREYLDKEMCAVLQQSDAAWSSCDQREADLKILQRQYNRLQEDHRQLLLEKRPGGSGVNINAVASTSKAGETESSVMVQNGADRNMAPMPSTSFAAPATPGPSQQPARALGKQFFFH